MLELKKEFGYDVAKNAFLKGALNPKFINDYRHSLELDSEGVPTFSSFIAIPYVQEVFIGKNTLIQSLNRGRAEVEDTIENYELLLEEAFNFNTKSQYKDSFVANIEYTSNNKLQLRISIKTEDNYKKFQSEYRQNQINKKLAAIFKPLGVTVGHLSKVEVNAGRIGVTDFTIADRIAQDFTSMIRVANNKEGAQAVSEEFAHLIIGVMDDNPFIKRSLNIIKNTPELMKRILGDDYESVVAIYNENMDLVAEEALGHILKNHLTNKISTEEVLFDRTINNIQQQFKSYKEKDIENALQEVNQLMAGIAKNVYDNSLPITREKIASKKRQVQLNALSDRITRNLDVLKKAKEVEIKRFRISSNEKMKNFAEDAVSLLNAPGSTEVETVITMHKYAQNALEEMRNYESALTRLSQMPLKEAFGVLRGVKNFIASYGNFINQVNDALIEDKEDEDSLVNQISPEMRMLQDVIKDLQQLSMQLTTIYVKKAYKAFTEFVKPYLGENVILKMQNAKGIEITVEELLNQADKDISFFDRWLDSMGDSADPLLQLFDQIVKQTKDQARLKTIDAVRESIKLRQEAEEAGITDFEWMFEKDAEGNKSGDYIHELHLAEFYRQYKEMVKNLDEKYGKNAKGEQATQKIAERTAWLKENATSTFGPPYPNNLSGKWTNPDYINLSDKQKEILKKFGEIKSKLDAVLPDSKITPFKAIQIRKNLSQRIIDSGASPSTIFSNLKEYYANAYLDRIDDDQLFGSSYKGGMRDFEGHEYMTLPILYLNRLENPNDISTDVFSSLMQYAYMAYNYEAMESVIDALETGRDIVKNTRKTLKTRGNLPVIEKIKTSVGNVTGHVFEDKTNIEQKLDDFFESQIYGKYFKDSGTWDVFGKQFNKNKIVSRLLSASALAQLGFNFLADTANVLTGSCMQHIEAAAGEYFTPKELLAADTEYTVKLLPEFLSELGARFKQSKLALFDELINFKGNYKDNLSKIQKKNILQRLFGENIAFIGQEGGDHWLYNRTAIAMAKRQKVIVPGEGELSLWDALEIIEVNGLKKMVLPEGTTDMEGKSFRITQWSRQVLHVNQSLFGIYNEEDSNAANRTILGKMLQQYRKWVKPQFNKRFQGAQQNLTSGKIEEGYYRTVLRICNELIRGHVQVTTMWNTLEDHEKRNVRRALFEIVQFFAIWALANWVEWPDDKKRPWAIKMAEYSAKRLSHELAGLTPSLHMVREMMKNVKNPLPITSEIINTTNLIGSLITPADYVDELQSGPYKGMSTLEKNILKSPIKVIRQYRQVDKFIDDIDTSIQYYARPY